MTFLPHTSFLLELAKGRVGGHELVTVFGANDAVSNAGVDLWNGTGDYPYPATAIVPNIVSSSALDTLLGTGARTVLVKGLNASYDRIQEVVSLNGITPVSASSSYMRIHSVRVLTGGSLAAAQGNVDVLNGVDLLARAIPTAAGVSVNHSRLGLFTVPNGYTGFVTRLFGSVSGGPDAILELMVRPLGSVFASEVSTDLTTQFFISGELAFGPIPSKADVKVRTVKITGAGLVRVKAGFTLTLVKNELLQG